MYVVALKSLAHLHNILYKSSVTISQNTLRMSIDRRFYIDRSGSLDMESLCWFHKFHIAPESNSGPRSDTLLLFV